MISQLVSALHIFIKQKTHFSSLYLFVRQSTSLHFIPFKMCYLHVISIFHMTYDIYFSSLSSTSLATFIWFLVFHVLTFRVYLIFVKAVVLILKHATLLRASNLPQSALTYAELGYQKANIDVAIQQHLMASASEHSAEQFAGFIMGIDIGLFILPFVTSISSHCLSAQPTQSSWNTFWSQMSFFAGRISQERQVGPMPGDLIVSIVKPCIMWHVH